MYLVRYEHYRPLWWCHKQGQECAFAKPRGGDLCCTLVESLLALRLWKKNLGEVQLEKRLREFLSKGLKHHQGFSWILVVKCGKKKLYEGIIINQYEAKLKILENSQPVPTGRKEISCSREIRKDVEILDEEVIMGWPSQQNPGATHQYPERISEPPKRSMDLLSTAFWRSLGWIPSQQRLSEGAWVCCMTWPWTSIFYNCDGIHFYTSYTTQAVVFCHSSLIRQRYPITTSLVGLRRAGDFQLFSLWAD